MGFTNIQNNESQNKNSQNKRKHIEENNNKF